MLAVTLSKEDVFKRPTNRNVPDAFAIQASKRFLDLLIPLAVKSKKWKKWKMPFLRHNGSVKRGINGY